MSRYLMFKDLRHEDHIYYEFGDLMSDSLTTRYADPLGIVYDPKKVCMYTMNLCADHLVLKAGDVAPAGAFGSLLYPAGPGTKAGPLPGTAALLVRAVINITNSRAMLRMRSCGNPLTMLQSEGPLGVTVAAGAWC